MLSSRWNRAKFLDRNGNAGRIGDMVRYQALTYFVTNVRNCPTRGVIVEMAHNTLIFPVSSNDVVIITTFENWPGKPDISDIPDFYL